MRRSRSSFRAAVERRQDRHLVRADAAARAADALFRRVWRDLETLAAANPPLPFPLLQSAIVRTLAQLHRVPAAVGDELAAAARTTARVTRADLIDRLPEQLPDRPLQEHWLDDLLPNPTREQVDAVVYSAGWAGRLGRLTSLSSADAIAALAATVAGQGGGPRDWLAAILPHVERDRVVARRVARDASLHVAHAVEMAAWESLGDDWVVGYQIHAVRDARTRPDHLARDGTRYFRTPEPGQLGFQAMPRPPFESAKDGGKLAYNCFLPGTIVSGRFEAALKARYSGKAIEIRTRAGERLSITPNHPVATTCGFRAAGTIRKGDTLLRHDTNVGPLSGENVHEQYGYALVEDVFRAAQELWPTGVKRRSRLDFHGDGSSCQEDVEVVAEERMLRRHMLAHPREFVGDLSFPTANSLSHILERSRPSLPGFGGVGSTGTSDMGRGGLFNPRAIVCPRPLRALGFGTAAKLDTCRRESANQASRRVDTVLGKVAATDPNFIREMLQRFPGVVSSDEVVEVREFEFAGHVYDFQSPDGWLSAANIIVSNCRCWLSPILADE